MYVINITTDYNSFTVCTDNENEVIVIIFKYLLLSIPSGILILCLISSIIWAKFKLLLTNKQMDTFRYPTNLFRCVITGPSKCGKSYFLTNLILNIINEIEKIYIYSPSLHQDLHQKLFK